MFLKQKENKLPFLGRLQLDLSKFRASEDGKYFSSALKSMK